MINMLSAKPRKNTVKEIVIHIKFKPMKVTAEAYTVYIAKDLKKYIVTEVICLQEIKGVF